MSDKHGVVDKNTHGHNPTGHNPKDEKSHKHK